MRTPTLVRVERLEPGDCVEDGVVDQVAVVRRLVDEFGQTAKAPVVVFRVFRPDSRTWTHVAPRGLKVAVYNRPAGRRRVS